MQAKEIVILGDIAFNGIISTESQKNNKRFEEIMPILSNADLVFANLEAPLKVDKTRNELKKFIHYSLPAPTAELLKLLNIGCVSLANNHIYDCKMSGLKATINLLDKLGIQHTGAGWLPEQIEPTIIEHNQQKIVFLAYVDQCTNPKTEIFPELYINYFTKEKAIADIKKAKSLGDKIIVSIHWGEDYSHYQTPGQVKTAHDLIDAGVDIIMGHHSHTLQPYEKYEESYIFYSLGGLTFGDYIKADKENPQSLFRKTKKGVIARYDLLSDTFNFISTQELKGNYIKTIKRDFEAWNKQKWRVFNLRSKYQFVDKWITLKEKILDRVIEYFFGYYQNPIKRLFQFSNLKKIKRLYKS